MRRASSQEGGGATTNQPPKHTQNAGLHIVPQCIKSMSASTASMFAASVRESVALRACLSPGEGTMGTPQTAPCGCPRCLAGQHGALCWQPGSTGAARARASWRGTHISWHHEHGVIHTLAGSSRPYSKRPLVVACTCRTQRQMSRQTCPSQPKRLSCCAAHSSRLPTWGRDTITNAWCLPPLCSQVLLLRGLHRHKMMRMTPFSPLPRRCPQGPGPLPSYRRMEPRTPTHPRCTATATGAGG